MVEYANVPVTDYPKLVQGTVPMKPVEATFDIVEEAILPQQQQSFAQSSFPLEQTQLSQPELFNPVLQGESLSGGDQSLFSKPIVQDLEEIPLQSEYVEFSATFDITPSKPKYDLLEIQSHIRRPTFQEAKLKLQRKLKLSGRPIMRSKRSEWKESSFSGNKSLNQKWTLMELRKHVDSGPDFQQAKSSLYNLLPHPREKTLFESVSDKTSQTLSSFGQTLGNLGEKAKDTAISFEHAIGNMGEKTIEAASSLGHQIEKQVELMQIESHIDHKGPSFDQAKMSLGSKLPLHPGREITEEHTLQEIRSERPLSIPMAPTQQTWTEWGQKKWSQLGKTVERIQLRSHIDQGPSFTSAKLQLETKLPHNYDIIQEKGLLEKGKEYLSSAVHSMQQTVERIELQTHIEKGAEFEEAKLLLSSQLPKHPGREVTEEHTIERLELEQSIDQGVGFEQARLNLSANLPEYPAREITEEFPADRIVYAEDRQEQFSGVGLIHEEKGFLERAKETLSNVASTIGHTYEKLEINSHIEQGPDFKTARLMLEKELPHNYDIVEEKSLFEKAKDTLTSFGKQMGQTVERIELQTHIEKGPSFTSAKNTMENKFLGKEVPPAPTMMESVKGALSSVGKMVGDTVELAELRWHIDNGPTFSEAKRKLQSKLPAADAQFKEHQALRKRLFMNIQKPQESWGKGGSFSKSLFDQSQIEFGPSFVESIAILSDKLPSDPQFREKQILSKQLWKNTPPPDASFLPKCL